MTPPIAIRQTLSALEEIFFNIKLTNKETLKTLFLESDGIPSLRKKPEKKIAKNLFKTSAVKPDIALPEFCRMIAGIKMSYKQIDYFSETDAAQSLLQLATATQLTLKLLEKYGDPGLTATQTERIERRIQKIKRCQKLAKKSRIKPADCSLGFLTTPLFKIASKFRDFSYLSTITELTVETFPTVRNIFVNSILRDSAAQKKKTEHGITLKDCEKELANFHSLAKDDDNVQQTLEKYNNNLSATWHKKLILGDVIHSFIPPCVISNGFSSSQLSQMIWDNKDTIIHSLLQKIPQIKVNANCRHEWDISESLYNNYGLKLDSSPKTDHRGLTLKALGREISIPNDLANRYLQDDCYQEDSKQFFSNPSTIIMCDVIELPKNRTGAVTTTICDGCGWGESAQKAAKTAAEVMQNFTEESVKDTMTLREIASNQIDALLKAHDKIVEGQTIETESGKTTALQVTVADGFLVATSLGDCKLYVIHPMGKDGRKECIDLTEYSQAKRSGSDPGGRLGSYLINTEGHFPQLDNLQVIVTHLDSGALIIAATDGLGDILDPIILGESPRLHGLECDKWNMDDEIHIAVRQKATTDRLLSIIEGKETLQEMNDALDAYASEKTAAYHADVIANPNKSKFDRPPSKPDHKATVLMRFKP